MLVGGGTACFGPAAFEPNGLQIIPWNIFKKSTETCFLDHTPGFLKCLFFYSSNNPTISVFQDLTNAIIEQRLPQKSLLNWVYDMSLSNESLWLLVSFFFFSLFF